MSEANHPNTYWNGGGRHQELHDRLRRQLVPETGPAATPQGELLRGLDAIYYDLYDNGGCNMDLGAFASHRHQLEISRDAIGERIDYADVDALIEALDALAVADPVEVCPECGAEVEPEPRDPVSRIFPELERVMDCVVLIVAEMEESAQDRAAALLEAIRDSMALPTVEHVLGAVGGGWAPAICTSESCEEVQRARMPGLQMCRSCKNRSVMTCVDLAAMGGR